MRNLDKLALTLLVVPNAYIIYLWFASDLNGVQTFVDHIVALMAGIAIDVVCISVLSWKENNPWKYMVGIIVGLGSASIAYFRYNGSFLTFDGGNMLHTYYPLAALIYMIFLAYTSNAAIKREEQKEREETEKQEQIRIEERSIEVQMRVQGKVQCPKCKRWFGKGGGFSVHKKNCKGG